MNTKNILFFTLTSIFCTGLHFVHGMEFSKETSESMYENNWQQDMASLSNRENWKNNSPTHEWMISAVNSAIEVIEEDDITVGDVMDDLDKALFEHYKNLTQNRLFQLKYLDNIKSIKINFLMKFNQKMDNTLKQQAEQKRAQQQQAEQKRAQQKIKNKREQQKIFAEYKGRVASKQPKRGIATHVKPSSKKRLQTDSKRTMEKKKQSTTNQLKSQIKKEKSNPLYE